MTADTPTPTPPEGDPRPTPDPSDAPTARHETPAEPRDPSTASHDQPTATHDAPTERHEATRVADPVTPPADPPPAGLYRSQHDRMLAGVSGGIAERYGIDAVIVRLAFLASLLMGGAGLLFYIAAAIVIPNPPADAVGPAGSPAGTPRPGVGNGILRIIVAVAVAFAALCGLLFVAGVSFGATVFFGAWPMAVVLVLLAALLAFVGKNRRSAATVLVLIVSIALPAAVAVIADLSVDRSAGERNETPLVASEAADGYRLGLGALTVDLSELPLEAGSPPLEVPIRVDVGRAAIVIPPDRCVSWTIRTSVGVGGEVRVLDRRRSEAWSGYRQTRTIRINPGGEQRPQVIVDARVGIGEIVIGDSVAAIDERRNEVRDSGRVIRTDACREGSSRRP
ncbi:MAG: PspC domain-containing protein [Patulibacter sp.]